MEGAEVCLSVANIESVGILEVLEDYLEQKRAEIVVEVEIEIEIEIEIVWMIAMVGVAEAVTAVAAAATGQVLSRSSRVNISQVEGMVAAAVHIVVLV